MKLLQFYHLLDPNKTVHVGVLISEKTIIQLNIQGNMRDVIRSLSSSAIGKKEIEQQIQHARETHELDTVKLLSPLTDPEKIICIGLNYYDHVIESKMEVPRKPVLFPKYNNCIVGDDDYVIIPEEVHQCDYEVELAVVIRKTAKMVPLEEAMDYVFGYTVLNDVSARDIQLHEPQWTRGKTIDTFAPVGPWIVTADEIPNPHQLSISLTLNGNIMQQSNTKELIFNIPYLISFLSNTITLQPGDIISTGTPPGVGMGKKPQIWLKHGDITEATIEGIGTLRNRFISRD
jgi:2-keto-4-pentenoate hydratase/2-oxohepta-3-ene-1,7-dioic acid hydratase in catechol pathway